MMPANTTWQNEQENRPYAYPLQSWQWGEFKGRWGWQVLPIFINEQTTALVLKRQLPNLPFSILYVPKGPSLDYENAPLRQQMWQQLEQLAQEQRALFIKVDPDVVLSTDLEPMQPNPLGVAVVAELQGRGWRYSDDQVQFRNTVELDLTPSENDILLGMKQKTRYNIRLATRKQVMVRAGTPADFPLLMQMYEETAQRDSFIIRQADYYLDAWQTFYDAGIGQPFFAEYHDEEQDQTFTLGAIYLLKYGQRAIYWHGASTQLERNRMPNYLLQWEAIRWAKAQGCTIYDFHGAPEVFNDSDPLWGVWRFKAGFKGQYVRHIGAWDFPVNRFGHWFYTQAMPFYIKTKRTLLR